MTTSRGGRRRVLVRGATLLRAGIVIAALILLLPLARGALPGMLAAALALLLVAAAAAVRHRWWVISTRAELEDAVAHSCRIALARSTNTDRGIHIELARADLLIRVRPRARHLFELRFDGPWQQHRKAELIRNAIAKQFEPPLPRIRIRLRR